MTINVTIENPRRGIEEELTDVRDYRVDDEGVIHVEYHRPGYDPDVTVTDEYGLDWRVKSITEVE